MNGLNILQILRDSSLCIDTSIALTKERTIGRGGTSFEAIKLEAYIVVLTNTSNVSTNSRQAHTFLCSITSNLYLHHQQRTLGLLDLKI